MVPAGKIYLRVKIQSPPTSQNDYGEISGSWTDFKTVWAGIEPVSSDEVDTARGFASTVSHKVTIRYRDDVSTIHRILYGVRVFEINGVINDGEAYENTILYCTEVI